MRWSDSRFRASRTAANASNRSSSSDSPCSSRCLELGRLGGELRVGELLEVGLERGDVGRLLGEPLHPPAFADAQDLLEAAEILSCHRVQGSLNARAATDPDLPEVAVEPLSPGRRTTRRAPRPAPRARARYPCRRAVDLRGRVAVVDGQRQLVAVRAVRELDDLDLRGSDRPLRLAAAGRLGAVGGTVATSSSASASGWTSPTLLDEQRVVGERDEPRAVALGPPPRPSRPRPTRAAAETPWMPTSIQPGGPASGSGSSCIPPSSASCSCSGLLPPEEAHYERLDQAEPAAAAAVDDVDLVRVLVPEDEEVVADELQLDHGLLRAHRLHRELLRLHDHGAPSSPSSIGTPASPGRPLLAVVGVRRRFSRYRTTWRSSLSVSRSIDARMSVDASRARSTGPFVQIVPSATWLSAIDGFFSTASSSSTRVGAASFLSSLASLVSA